MAGSWLILAVSVWCSGSVVASSRETDCYCRGHAYVWRVLVIEDGRVNPTPRTHRSINKYIYTYLPGGASRGLVGSGPGSSRTRPRKRRGRGTRRRAPGAGPCPAPGGVCVLCCVCVGGGLLVMMMEDGVVVGRMCTCTYDNRGDLAHKRVQKQSKMAHLPAWPPSVARGSRTPPAGGPTPSGHGPWPGLPRTLPPRPAPRLFFSG